MISSATIRRIREHPALRQIRIFGRVVATLCWTLLLLPIQTVTAATGQGLAEKLPRLYHAGLCRILGIEVSVVGSPVTLRPALFVANHSSWMDILVLGCLVECSFIAKAEVGRWPGVGLLARLQRTEFVERSRQRTNVHAAGIQRRLDEQSRLVIFPEGTSTDGSYVLPFKSSLFTSVERPANCAGPIVQPVTVAYVMINGEIATQQTRPAVAWYGDMTFAPHFLGVLQLTGIAVRVTFHDPAPEAVCHSRKTLARYCERVVVAEHARLIGGASSNQSSQPSMCIDDSG
jgi:1-acyl-sn-glycerol-3-phosphate acyltransferase